MTDTARDIPLGSNVSPELAILDAGIKIRKGIEAAPFIWHTDVQLAWHPKTAAPAGGTKINVGRVDLYTVFVLAMKNILCRRQPEVASVTLSSCDDSVRVNRLKLDETVPGASTSERVQIRVHCPSIARWIARGVVCAMPLSRTIQVSGRSDCCPPFRFAVFTGFGESLADSFGIEISGVNRRARLLAPRLCQAAGINTIEAELIDQL
jgi:hypothetical protein